MGAAESSWQEEPEPGDLIEISRNGTHYNHWALYMGGGNVIHLSVVDRDSSMGLVRKEPLHRVADGGKYRISKKYDERYNRRPRRQILRDAEAMVGEWVPYDYFSSEYFATGLTHGVRGRQQVENRVSTGAVFGVGVAVVALAGLAAAAALTDTPQRRSIEEGNSHEDDSDDQ